jgi:hypothetical protein
MEAVIKILLNENKPPVNKLADAELHFRGGVLDGMRLVGFAVWRRRDRAGSDVILPSREFTVAGRRRRYALLRSVGDSNTQNGVRDAVLDAYAACEAASRGRVQ